jgi:hypothetical protein
MSTRSALAGAATTLVLAGVLGSPAVQDRATEDGAPLLTRTVTALPSWEVPDGAPARLVWGIVLRLAVLLVVALGLCAVAGRAQSRGAAFLAGWGGLVVAAGLAGAVAYVYTVAVVLDGGTLGDITGDGVVAAVNSGIGFGAWTGWLVGLAVAIATRTEPAEVFAEDYTAEYPAHAAPAATGTPRRITDPPAPWWAPTATTGTGGTMMRPGPSVFPAGGMPPVVAGVEPGEPLQVDRPTPAPASPPDPAPTPDEGATRELTTASGDPHPSDPDATQAVGIPETAPEAAPRVDDPDATTTIPETTDPTREMPRRTD